jgi:hypothetical protein
MRRFDFPLPRTATEPYQPRNVDGTPLRERTHVIATEGVPNQNIGPLDTGVMKRAAQLIRDADTRAGMGPGSLKPAPARS